MAAQTEVDVASTELERVRPKVPALFYWEDTFYSNIQKSTTAEVVSNREARIPLQLRQGGKFRHWDPAGGSLGVGSGSQFKHAAISIEHLAIVFEYQTLAKWATDKKRKAVVNSVQKQLAKAMSEFRQYCDNLALADGTGRLAKITAVSSGVVTCGEENGIKLLREGQDVLVFDDNALTMRTTTNTDNRTTVTKYDPANNQVTLSPVPASMAVNDIIVVHGLGNEDGTNLSAAPTSVLGVKYHYSNSSSGNWLKLSRSTYPQIRANRVNAAGALGLTQVRLAKNMIGDRYGIPAKRMKKAKIWCHAAQKQAYEQLGQLVSIVNKEAKEQNLELYFGDNMMMAGLPLMEHTSWDKSRLDIIDTGIWGRVELHPPDFYSVEGRRMFERRASDGSVQASTMYHIVASMNLFIDNPIRAAYVDGLTVPAGY